MILISQFTLLVTQLVALYVAFFGRVKSSSKYDLIIPKIYLLLSTFQVVAFIVFRFGFINTVMMYVFSIFETIFLARYIASGTFRRLGFFLGISIVLTFMYILSFFNDTSFLRYELCVVLEQTYILGLCLSYIFITVKNESNYDLAVNRKFWIISGTMIFNGSTLPLFVMEYFNRKLEFTNFHMLTCVFFLFTCLLFIKAFKCSECKTINQHI